MKRKVQRRIKFKQRVGASAVTTVITSGKQQLPLLVAVQLLQKVPTSESPQ